MGISWWVWKCSQLTRCVSHNSNLHFMHFQDVWGCRPHRCHHRVWHSSFNVWWWVTTKTELWELLKQLWGSIKLSVASFQRQSSWPRCGGSCLHWCESHSRPGSGNSRASYDTVEVVLLSENFWKVFTLFKEFRLSMEKGLMFLFFLRIVELLLQILQSY